MPRGQKLLVAGAPRFCRQRRFVLLSFCLSNLFRIWNLGLRIS